MTGLSDWAVALDVTSRMIYSQGAQVVVGCLLQPKDQLRQVVTDLCNLGKKKQKGLQEHVRFILAFLGSMG